MCIFSYKLSSYIKCGILCIKYILYLYDLGIFYHMTQIFLQLFKDVHTCYYKIFLQLFLIH